MLKTGRWREAARLAGQVVQQYSSSPNAAEARYLFHRALLEETLERADVEKAAADPRTELLFVDEPRTRALARVRVGYGGGDVLLRPLPLPPACAGAGRTEWPRLRGPGARPSRSRPSGTGGMNPPRASLVCQEKRHERTPDELPPPSSADERAAA